VAEDTQDSLKVSYSGFYIGAGKEGSPEPNCPYCSTRRVMASSASLAVLPRSRPSRIRSMPVGPGAGSWPLAWAARSSANPAGAPYFFAIYIFSEF